LEKSKDREKISLSEALIIADGKYPSEVSNSTEYKLFIDESRVSEDAQPNETPMLRE
jgi:hypothetical protein